MRAKFPLPWGGEEVVSYRGHRQGTAVPFCFAWPGRRASIRNRARLALSMPRLPREWGRMLFPARSALPLVAPLLIPSPYFVNGIFFFLFLFTFFHILLSISRFPCILASPWSSARRTTVPSKDSHFPKSRDGGTSLQVHFGSYPLRSFAVLCAVRSPVSLCAAIPIRTPKHVRAVKGSAAAGRSAGTRFLPWFHRSRRNLKMPKMKKEGDVRKLSRNDNDKTAHVGAWGRFLCCIDSLLWKHSYFFFFLFCQLATGARSCPWSIPRIFRIP